MRWSRLACETSDSTAGARVLVPPVPPSSTEEGSVVTIRKVLTRATLVTVVVALAFIGGEDVIAMRYARGGA
jgi:hypothetical protein